MADVRTIRITLDASNANQVTQGLEGDFERVRQSANQAGEETSKFGDILNDARTQFAAVLAVALVASDQLLKSISDYQGLADAIGTSATALQNLQTVADVSGTSMEKIASAINKMQLGLNKIGEDSGSATEALRALGITGKDLEKFLAARPEERLKIIATAMDQFAGDANKVQVAMGLFGKSGGDLVPFFNDLAGEQQKNIELSAEQIWNADEYAKMQTRLITTTKQLAQVMLSDASPSFTILTGALNDTLRQMFNVNDEADNLAKNSSLSGFAEGFLAVVGFIGDMADGVARVIQSIGMSLAAVTAQAVFAVKGDFASVKQVAVAFNADMEKLFTRPMYSDNVKKNIKQYKDDLKDLREEVNRPAKPSLEYDPNAAKKAAEAKAAAEKAAKEYQSQMSKYKAELDGLTGKYDPLEKKQRDFKDDMAKIAELSKLSEGELKKLGYTKADLADLTDKANKKQKEEKSIMKENIESVQEQIRLMGFSKEAREAEAAGIALVTKLKAAKETVDEGEIKRYKELLTVLKQRQKEEAFDEAQTDKIKGINDEIKLVGVYGKERERQAQEQSIRRDAEKAGIKDVEGAVRSQMDAYDSLNRAVEEHNSIMSNGAKQALTEYIEQAANVAEAARSAVTSVLGTLEDTLAKFFQTGKFGFKDFVAAINVELSKIAARQVSGLIAQGLSGLFTAKADGGDFQAGTSMLVGERGPEILTNVPFSGSIVPNHVLNQQQSSQAIMVDVGGITIAGGSNLTRSDLMAFGAQLSNQISTDVMKKVYRETTAHNGKFRSK